MTHVYHRKVGAEFAFGDLSQEAQGGDREGVEFPWLIYVSHVYHVGVSTVHEPMERLSCQAMGMGPALLPLLQSSN